jgi:hypothetical protein
MAEYGALYNHEKRKFKCFKICADQVTNYYIYLMPARGSTFSRIPRRQRGLHFQNSECIYIKQTGVLLVEETFFVKSPSIFIHPFL